MTFVNRINPGDTWIPSATALNSLAEAANRMGERGAGRGKEPAFDGAIRVLAYNTSSQSIPAGCAVNLLGTTSVDGVVPCTAYTSEELPWGVAENVIPAGGCGPCIVDGVAVIEAVATGTGRYVKPNAGTPTAFIRADTGDAMFLCSGTHLNGGHYTVVKFGSSGGNEYCYNGCFKIVLDGTSHGAPTAVSGETDPTLTPIVAGIGTCNSSSSSGSSSSGSSSSGSSSSGSSSSGSSSAGSSSETPNEGSLIVSVVDGAFPSSSVAGGIYYGDQYIAVNAASTSISSTCYVFCEFNGTAGSIAFHTSLPTASATVHRVLLGRVVVSDGSARVIQEHHGAISYPHSYSTLGGLIARCVRMLFNVTGG